MAVIVKTLAANFLIPITNLPPPLKNPGSIPETLTDALRREAN